MVAADFVDKLWQARSAGDFCPEWLPGALTFEEALEVQLGLLERELAAGETLGGWKVGLTSPRARAAIKADVRPFGYVLESRIFASGATIDAEAIRAPSIEPELCFTIGAALSGPVSREQVAAAISTISAGFEINERRTGSARPDMPAMTTDRLTQWGIVVGEGVALAAAGDLGAIHCTLTRNGESVYEGISRDELDDHLDSLGRLVQQLGAYGRRLEPGQRVITGAFARRDAAGGQVWRTTYEPVGAVELTLR